MGYCLSIATAQGSTIKVLSTDRHEGDFSLAGEGVDVQRASLVSHPWAWLDQVHGTEVVWVDEGQSGLVGVGDVAATRSTNLVLSVRTADCGSFVLGASMGFAVVHAGWRGLAGGVVRGSVEAMRRTGGDPEMWAWLGPCAGPECYEFDPEHLDRLECETEGIVRSETTWGMPSLDLRGSIRSILEAEGVTVIGEDSRCTICCDAELYSHRRSGDVGRQILAAWLERP